MYFHVLNRDWPFRSASLLASVSVSLVSLGWQSSSSRPSSHTSKGLNSISASSKIGSLEAFWYYKEKRKQKNNTLLKIRHTCPLKPLVFWSQLKLVKSCHLSVYWFLHEITLSERNAPDESKVPASSSASSRHHSGRLSLSSSRLPLPDLGLR